MLHFSSFEIPNELAAAEKTINRNQNCLQLLLHWNSSPGEGLGNTHQKLSLRLRQIGRNDLSDWLTTSVFKQLSKSLNETFQTRSNTDELPRSGNITLSDNKDEETNPFPLRFQGWSFLDTILFLIFFFVLCVISLYTIKACCSVIYWRRMCNSCIKRFKNVEKGTKTYQKLLKQENSSGNESN
ncbi:hypothetical protein AAG570_001871 [Ranatra chinensis]|uniref:Uncharacterized protein n=1 Tax=Ranatra chinensis TaxID=642074 RepID=A0ABD0YA08_9HEMI